MNETQPLKLTADQNRKMRELMQMFSAKKEEARRYNYNRPERASHAKAFQRAQARANKRVEDVVLGLMRQYAGDQQVEFEALQRKIAEDPAMLEPLYAQAIEMIPDHYLPIQLSGGR